MSEYDSARPYVRTLHELQQLRRYRALLWLLITNQIKLRYRRSVLGVVWLVISPLLNTAVLSVAFRAVFHSNVENYPAYALSGMLAWNFFAQATAAGIGAAIGERTLTTRFYLPRSMFILAAVGSSLFNLLLGLVPLLAIMLLSGIRIAPTWWLFPLAVAILGLSVVGVSLLIAPFAVVFDDVTRLYELLLQAGFFLTPVIYPLAIVPETYRWVVGLNPLTTVVELFRALLYEGRLPDPGAWLYPLAVGLLMCGIGWWVFSRRADEFAAYL